MEYAMSETKFCQFCGKSIPNNAVFCASCGSQIEESRTTGQYNTAYQEMPRSDYRPNQNIVVNNTTYSGREYREPKNKWISLALCFFTLFGHKFYEGKIGLGIAYIFTGAFFGIGWIVDLFVLACKPTYYYVD